MTGVQTCALPIYNSHLVFKHYDGVRCNDFAAFFVAVTGNPLQIYLNSIEDETHGNLHFTFGGVGGNAAMEAVNSLIDNYGFTYSNIGSLAASAQGFFKSNFLLKSLLFNNDHPVNCTANPWQNYMLRSTAEPGQIGGPSCDFADKYYKNDTTLMELVEYFFFSDLDQNDRVKTRLANLEFTERAKAMKVVANMFPYDGDLAGAGAGKNKIR